MRFGLQLRADDPTRVGADAQRAEQPGFDSVLVADHVGSDWSPLLCLAAAAAATERIRVGTFVRGRPGGSRSSSAAVARTC